MSQLRKWIKQLICDHICIKLGDLDYFATYYCVKCHKIIELNLIKGSIN